MKLKVKDIVDNGEIVSLILEMPARIALLQDMVINSHEGQHPIEDLHVTLCASGKEMLPPPPFIYLDGEVYMVEREDKTSTYMKLSPYSVDNLSYYTCGTDRVLHVSITNLTGEARSSIAKVWDYEAEVIWS